MAPDAPEIHLPNASDLNTFLDGEAETGGDTTDQSSAVDTATETLRADDADTSHEDHDQEELPPGDTFDRKYVEKLRRENASYRERARKYESAFEGYEEGAVEEWKTLITGFRSDPKSVAEQMKQLSEQILGQFTPEEQEEITEALTDEDQPLTMKQLQGILDQRAQEQELDNMVQDIEREAHDLGYNLKSREYKVLLMTAQELPSGSIKEAHDLLQGERQRVIDEYVADMEKGAGRVTPSSKVGIPDTSKDIKSFKDAKEALANFLDGSFK